MVVELRSAVILKTRFSRMVISVVTGYFKQKYNRPTEGKRVIHIEL